MLPSRSYKSGFAGFQSDGKSLDYKTQNEYTVDGGAGGVELLDWYENNYGTFWVMLAYDKYSEFNVGGVVGTKDATSYTHLQEYNEALEMYITNFDYTIEKRGASTLDLWNVTMTLEEA